MINEKCREAIIHINPRDGFNERVLKHLSVKKARILRQRRIIRITAIAAACIAAGVFLAFDPFAASGAPAQRSGAIAYVSEMPSAPAETEHRLVLNGSPVLYSSLDFGYTGRIEYPDTGGTEAMCLVAFSEDMLSRSQLVIKGTVEDVRIKNYFRNAKTAVYSIRADRIFYSELDVSEGDIFTVEQELHGGSIGDSEFGLQPGGQYILPICEGSGIITEFSVDETEQTAELESPYSIVYPFQPMIQATADGGYLFFGSKDEYGPSFGWGSLVNENTVDVIMDMETVYGGQSYVHNMKLRADSEFEEDFQALVDYYCPAKDNLDGKNFSDVPPYGSDITLAEALGTAEKAAGGMEPTPRGYFDPVHMEWVISVECWYPEETVTVHISPAGEVTVADHGEDAGGSDTEIIDIGISEIEEPATVNDIVVPFYLPQRLSDGTEISCGISKDGYRAWIWNGDTLVVDMRYLDADSEFLKGAPETGKAAVTLKGGKYELVMMINEGIGCIMKAEGIPLEELVKTAGSFGNDAKPANNMPYDRGYD